MIETPMSVFEGVLTEHLIPEYQMGDFLKGVEATFKATPLHFGDEDAHYFNTARELGLINHVGGGKYATAQSGAYEKFFNSGAKSQSPRTFTLAQEAVITVGVLARLHLDHGWPQGLIGTQSQDYAFDAVAFLPEAQAEHIACEVKKTTTEVEKLLQYMHGFCAAGTPLDDAAQATLKSDGLNAYRKVVALHKRRAPIFWAVGPNGLSQVFEAHYPANGWVALVATSEAALKYPAA